MANSFKKFQKASLAVLAQSNNCQESQDRFRAATSVPELVSAWQHYWGDMIKEVPEQTIAALAEYYPTYRQDINRAGLYFNEAPPFDAFPSIVLIGDKGSVCGDTIATLEITGRHRVFVLGDLPVEVREECSVYVGAERASVNIYNTVRCTMSAGTVTAHDRSTVTGSGNITSHDATTILITGGKLEDNGHYSITAYNDAVVNSFTDRKISICDNAKLNITK